MTNNEIFEAIDQLQYVQDKHAKSGVYQFANQDDIKLLEKVYNHITKRQYIKFNAGCSSCIKESFLILQNWSKRELKKMEAIQEEITNPFNPEGYDDNQVDNANVEFELEEKSGLYKAKLIEEVPAPEAKEEPKPIKTTKSNGRGKRK